MHDAVTDNIVTEGHDLLYTHCGMLQRWEYSAE